LKKKTETEPKPGQTDRFRFGFLGQKPFGFSGFGSVFSVLARFFRFGLVFSVWLGFFPVFCRFWFGSVRFGFLLIKPKPNRTGKTETEPNRLVF
jgi:hypothetical protein